MLTANSLLALLLQGLRSAFLETLLWLLLLRLRLLLLLLLLRLRLRLLLLRMFCVCCGFQSDSGHRNCIGRAQVL